MNQKIEVTKDFLQRVEDALSIAPTSAHGRAVRQEIEGMLGGWKPLSDLRGRISTGRDVAEIYELLSLDGKTGVLAVSVGIPSKSPVDMLVVINTRDGIPILVDQQEFSGWRPYKFPEDPS